MPTAQAGTCDEQTLNGFFVAPDGSTGGDGTRDRPWDLKTALEHPSAVKPGDTIWLEGGTYKGHITNSRGLISFLKGTADKPIIVRAVPGQRVTIDMNDGDASTNEFLPQPETTPGTGGWRSPQAIRHRVSLIIPDRAPVTTNAPVVFTVMVGHPKKATITASSTL
ncbi:MAG: hypothetical protein R3C68_14600 [Myxococcota bacterium]